jgi:signal transduction histidine kinase
MDAITDFLRKERDRLIDLWEQEVRQELPTLQHMPRPVLTDHMFELLEGLGAWIDGRPVDADRGFEALIEGHALQRLGYGVGIETVMREYGKLRYVVLRELLAINPRPESMILLHEGFDRAVSVAIERYAQRREHVRARFISILGHDLRDPLSTVKISADILARSDKLADEHRMVIARIARATDRMQRMIAEVLDFARGHLGGGIPATPTLNDMVEICRHVVDELSAAHPARAIALDTRGDLRGPFDRDRVSQALGNLVSNGIEHGQGSIEVAAYESDDREHVITKITSHGKPIAPDVLPRLFDPFMRGDDAVARRGLGLGLYIAHQIALAHGATIDVTSDDTATVFTITWPRVRSESRLAAASG